MWSLVPRDGRTRSLRRAAIAGVVAGACACGPAPLAPAAPGAEASASPGATPASKASPCAASSDPLHPIVLGWSGRVELAERAKKGVVVARYEGCKLEVLPACDAHVAYAYSGLSARPRAVDAPTDPERLGGAGAKVDAVATGQKIAIDIPARLDGEGCERATHWIRRATFGARVTKPVTPPPSSVPPPDAPPPDAPAPSSAPAPSEAPPPRDAPPPSDAPPPHVPVEPAPGCGSRAFATSEEADAAGCGELVEIDLAPLEHVAGTSEIFSAGFGVELGAASDAGALRARYLSDRASLDRLRGLPEAELPPEMKAAYEREFDAVYGPREAALRATLGADYAPVVPSTSPSLPARPRFAFRAVADGGFDGAQLSYTGSGSGAVLASGYGGLTLALPQIPAPNVGLSVRARFASGPDWSRFQIGAGIQFIADVPPAGAGIDIGLHASYGYFLSANCDDPEGDAACGELTNIVATSDGGADIRASVDYEYLVARVLLLTAGGDVGFAFYPYTRPNGEGDVAKGLVFGLHAGLGLGL